MEVPSRTAFDFLLGLGAGVGTVNNRLDSHAPQICLIISVVQAKFKGDVPLSITRLLLINPTRSRTESQTAPRAFWKV